MAVTNTTTVITPEEMDNAIVVQLKVDNARLYIDGETDTIVLEDNMDFDEVVDEAQERVFTGDEKRVWIMIEVLK
jgi:hypothetical protein